MNEEKKIDINDLPEFLKEKQNSRSLKPATLKTIENEHIKNILSYTKGNKSKAAKILGITRKTLREKINRME